MVRTRSQRLISSHPDAALHIRRMAAIRDLRKKWQPRKYRNKASRGLQNVNAQNSGAWCYRNGARETLLHLPAFIHFLELLRDGRVPPAQNARMAMKHFTSIYWTAATASTQLRTETTAFDSACNTFGWWDSDPRNHADASEFLSFLLGSMRNDQTLIMTPVRSPKFYLGRPELYDGLFAHAIDRTWTCAGCGKSDSHVDDSITPLIVHVNTQTGRTPLINYITASLSDSTEIRCDHQSCPQAASQMRHRTGTFKALPEYFIMYLLPYRTIPPSAVVQSNFDSRMARWNALPPARRRARPIAPQPTVVKVPTTVDVPERLDLSQVMKWPVTDNQRSAFTYDLASVVKHTGETADMGHYTGMFEAPDGSKYEINNETVTQTTYASYMSSFGPSDSPFIVTYRRIERPAT